MINKKDLPNRANIVAQLPDGRYVIGVGLPIFTREEADAIYAELGKALGKTHVAIATELTRITRHQAG